MCVSMNNVVGDFFLSYKKYNKKIKFITRLLIWNEKKFMKQINYDTISDFNFWNPHSGRVIGGSG